MDPPANVRGGAKATITLLRTNSMKIYKELLLFQFHYNILNTPYIC